MRRRFWGWLAVLAMPWFLLNLPVGGPPKLPTWTAGIPFTYAVWDSSRLVSLNLVAFAVNASMPVALAWACARSRRP